MNTPVIESLKSEKQRLYETYILDSQGRLMLYCPIVQGVLLDILEAGGLEAKVKAHDKEVKDALKK